MVIFFKIHETKPAVTDEKSDAPLTRQLFRELWTKFSIIFTDRVFGLYILAGVFAIITIMQLDLYLAVYVMNHVPAQPLIAWNHWFFKLSSSEVFGWLLGLNGLMFVVLVLPISSWLKSWRERNILLLSCCLSGFGTFAVGLNSKIWYLFFVTIIFTLGEIVRSPVTQSFVSNYAPEHSRGLYLGASNLQFTIGRFLAPISVFLSAWVPPMGIFSILLFFALVGMSLYYYLFRIC